MNDGAGDGEAAELFERFVKNIARIEIWNNKNIGLALEWAIWSLLAGDAGVNGGI